MASLLSVPLEILLQITSYLTTPEYGCLRRTCKQVEASLFGAFALEFFSRRQFALIEFSIQALVDISRSRFAPCLRHIIIHLEHPYFSTDNPSYAVGVDGFLRYNRYQAECIQHYEFIYTGLDLEMLTEAIKNLPYLETIGMRDFNSRRPSRDGAAWRSYGAPTFLRETGGQLHAPVNSAGFERTRGFEYTCYVFLTILRAMGNAAVSGCGPNITRIEVLLHRCNMRDHSFKIPDRLDASLSVALSRLTTIFLDGLGPVRPSPIVLEYKEAHVIGANFYLSRLLAKMPALEHLRLNFQFHSYHEPERFLEWIAGAEKEPCDATSIFSLAAANADKSLPAPFPPTPGFSNLHTLELGMLTVTANVLTALIKKYKTTLRSLSFHKATIIGLTPAEINYWARLCTTIAESGVALTRLQLSHVKQVISSRSLDVTFPKEKDENILIWRGSTYSQAVQDITTMIIVDWEEFWRRLRSRDDEDDSMDEDEDEEEHDIDEDEDNDDN